MNETTTEGIRCFMLATDWMFPTDTTPDIRGVHDIHEQYEAALMMGDKKEWIRHADDIKQDCLRKHFLDGWEATFPKWFQRKDGTKTMNVQFYVEEAENIMENSGLEEWNFEFTNLPFFNRIYELRDFLSWFLRAEDSERLIRHFCD